MTWDTRLGIILGTGLLTGGMATFVAAAFRWMPKPKAPPTGPATVVSKQGTLNPTDDDIALLLKYTSATEYRTRHRARELKGLAKANDLIAVRSEIDALQAAVDDLKERLTANLELTASATANTARLNRPNAIRAIALESSASQQFGRNAASVQRDHSRENNMKDLLTPSEDPQQVPRSHAAVIATGQLQGSLKAVCDVEALSPTFMTISPDVSWIILESSEFFHGAWDHTLTTLGTHRYKDFRAMLRRARQQGTAIVMIKSSQAHATFISDLESMCDLIYTKSGIQTEQFGWVGDESTPVVSAVARYAREKFSENDYTN